MKYFTETIIKQETHPVFEISIQSTHRWAVIYVLPGQPTSDILGKFKFKQYLSKHLFSLKEKNCKFGITFKEWAIHITYSYQEMVRAHLKGSSEQQRTLHSDETVSSSANLYNTYKHQMLF